MFAGLRGAGSQLLFGREIAVVVVAVIGAFGAGFIMSSAFGRPGWAGWMICAVGAVLATTIGALLGGLLLFGNIADAYYCLFMVAISITSYPVTATGWVASMTAIQILALVFVPKIPADLDLVPGPDNL